MALDKNRIFHCAFYAAATKFEYVCTRVGMRQLLALLLLLFLLLFLLSASIVDEDA